MNAGKNETTGLILRLKRPHNEATIVGPIAGRQCTENIFGTGGKPDRTCTPLRTKLLGGAGDQPATLVCGRRARIRVHGTAQAMQGSMNGQANPPIKPAGAPKQPQPKPAIRLDDLIPNEKVLGGRRVIFGVRAKPLSKS
jgi:hypothetical protein